MKRDLEDNLAAEVRRMSDMDARITALNRKITSVEETLEAKLNTVCMKSDNVIWFLSLL